MTRPLRGQQTPDTPHQIGSLRNVQQSMSAVPGHCVAGGRIRDLLSLFLEEHTGSIDACCDSLGTDKPIADIFPVDDIVGLRRDIHKLIRANHTQIAPDLSPIPDCRKPGIQGELLHSWSEWARDPASHAAHWILTGAPAGISVDFELDGVLERVVGETPLTLDQLESNPDSFANYKGVEDDPDALAIVEGYISNGWLREFDTLEELTVFVDGPPILNKFACISKTRLDGTVKRRIIMDSKKSLVTDASKKQYKAVLPRATDLITDFLACLSESQPGDELDGFVCDADDAFWQVPLDPRERKFYCSMLRRPNGRTTYVAYTRTAQGSRGAPLSWAIVFGLICRCAFSTLRLPDGSVPQRLQVYVDDPIVVLRGPRQQRRKQVALMVLAWVVLGISLAIKKSQLGPNIDWIGVSFAVHTWGVQAFILASRMEEISALADAIFPKNVVGLKDLRSFVGKVQSVASLLYMWRPFVHMFYACIHSEPGDAPPGCRWVSQIRVPLMWIRAFLQGTSGNLVRTFTLEAYLRLGDSIVITTDASPYGIGGVLEINSQIVSYFGDRVHPNDRKVLMLRDTPSSADQQALEALAILVALREWAPRWTNKRVSLTVRTDNIAALTMIGRLQPHSEQLGILAREVALDIAASTYSPDEVQHIPGITNTAADYLSRLHAPTSALQKPKSAPPYLPPQLYHKCHARGSGWWKALARKA